MNYGQVCVKSKLLKLPKPLPMGKHKSAQLPGYVVATRMAGGFWAAGTQGHCSEPITPASLVLGVQPRRTRAGHPGFLPEPTRPQDTLTRGSLTGFCTASGPVPRHQKKAPKFHTAKPRGGHSMSQQGHKQTVKVFSSVEERKPLAVLLASTDVVYI